MPLPPTALSHRHTLHTLTGATLRRCGIRRGPMQGANAGGSSVLIRQGPPFGFWGRGHGIAGSDAKPGRLCTAYRAPRARHRRFPRPPSTLVHAFRSAPMRGPLPSPGPIPPPRSLAGPFFVARALARGAPVGVAGLAAVPPHTPVYAASAFTVPGNTTDATTVCVLDHTWTHIHIHERGIAWPAAVVAKPCM